MMTNFELESAAEKAKVPLIFCGYKDQLTTVKKQNGGYILNLRDAKNEKGNWNPGTHWVACYIEGKNQFYFDSFGFPPPRVIDAYLSHHYVWNHQDIQNVHGGHCGQYCLAFLLAMTRKKDGETASDRWLKFHRLFSTDPTKNIAIVDSYLHANGVRSRPSI